MNLVCYFSSGYESPAYHGEPRPSRGAACGAQPDWPGCIAAAKETKPGGSQRCGRLNHSPRSRAGWRQLLQTAARMKGEEGHLFPDILLLFPSPPLPLPCSIGSGLSQPGSGLEPRAAFPAFISVPLQEGGAGWQERQRSPGMEGRASAFYCLTGRNLHLSHRALKAIL